MTFRASLYFALGVMLLLALDSFGSIVHASTLPLQQGGTGLTLTAAGDLLIGTTSKAAFSILHVGTDGYTLQASSTAPFKIVWAAITPASGFATSSANYWLSTKSTSDLPQGTNLYYTDSLTKTYLDTLSKGYFFSTTSASYFLTLNQAGAFSTTSASYFLSQNQGAAYATTSANYWLSTKSTSNVSEGANLYYTDARVAATIDASTTIPHIGGNAFGDMLQWSGTAWATTSTSTLGISGGAALVGDPGNVAYFSASNAAQGTSTITIDGASHVGIATTTPITALTVFQQFSSAPQNVRGIANILYFTGAQGPTFDFIKARGTPGSPTSINAVDTLGTIAFAGYDGTNAITGALTAIGAQITGQATDAWSAIDHGSKIFFNTVPNGGTAQITRMTIDQSGNIGIATTTYPAALNVGGDIYNTGGIGVGLWNTTAGTLKTSGAATIGGNITGLDTTVRTLTTTGDNTLGGFTNISNRINSYNGWVTAAPGVPPIMASVQRTGLGAAVTATTILNDTTTSSGMYRVCWSAKRTRIATTSSVLGGTSLGLQLIYTDANDGQTVTTQANLAGSTNATNTLTGQASGCLVVYAQGSTNIQYEFGYTSVGATTMQYELEVEIEKISSL